MDCHELAWVCKNRENTKMCRTGGTPEPKLWTCVISHIHGSWRCHGTWLMSTQIFWEIHSCTNLTFFQDSNNLNTRQFQIKKRNQQFDFSILTWYNSCLLMKLKKKKRSENVRSVQKFKDMNLCFSSNLCLPAFGHLFVAYTLEVCHSHVSSMHKMKILSVS